MESDSVPNHLTSVGTSQAFRSEVQLSQEPENVVLRFLERRVLHPFLRFYIYVGWAVLIIFALLPIFSSTLRPFWRIICWVAPTLLAVEVNAGNRTWVYVSKTVVWILQVFLTQYMLWVTDGFRRKSDLQRVGLPLSVLLFFASCIITIAGIRQRNTVWFRGDLVKVGTNLRFVDKTVYANIQHLQVRAKLSKHELKHAWVCATDVESGRRLLTEKEVSRHVIRTSLVTQFVVARVFKDVNNRVFVYCPVAQYRTILLTIALVIAGVVHIGQELFDIALEREVITSMILWLTLPSITLPALVRIKFGSHATLLYLLKGLLPVETDTQMWKRLGISAQDLYTALTNAFSAERVLKDEVGLAEGHGKGTVKVNNTKEANGLCIKSLLRVGDKYVRVSDGKRFDFYQPRVLMNLSQLRKYQFPYYRTKCECQESIESNKSEENSSGRDNPSIATGDAGAETDEQVEFSLDADSRILRMT